MNFDCPFVDVRVGWQPPGSRSSHQHGHRLPAILLLVLLLAGCGGGPRGTGYADRPPSDRVAYTAWQEWTRFGRSTVVYGGHAGAYVNRSGVSDRSDNPAELRSGNGAHPSPLARAIHGVWGDILDAQQRILEATTLADLLQRAQSAYDLAYQI